MLPLLKQCYDSAISARSLASAIKSGEVGSLRLAIGTSPSSRGRPDLRIARPRHGHLESLMVGLEGLKLIEVPRFQPGVQAEAEWRSRAAASRAREGYRRVADREAPAVG
jgi:hypothetical protein